MGMQRIKEIALTRPMCNSGKESSHKIVPLLEALEHELGERGDAARCAAKGREARRGADPHVLVLHTQTVASHLPGMSSGGQPGRLAHGAPGLGSRPGQLTILRAGLRQATNPRCPVSNRPQAGVRTPGPRRVQLRLIAVKKVRRSGPRRSRRWRWTTAPWEGPASS